MQAASAHSSLDNLPAWFGFGPSGSDPAALQIHSAQGVAGGGLVLDALDLQVVLQLLVEVLRLKGLEGA